MNGASEEQSANSNGRVPLRPPLSREHQLVVGRVLASKPLPFKPTPFPRERLSTITMWASVGVAMAGWVAWHVWLRASWATALVAAGIAGCFAARVFFLPVARRQAVGLIRGHDGFICPRCHYPLSTLPDEGQCPECATLYTRDQIVSMWKWKYKLKDPFTRRTESFRRVSPQRPSLKR